MSELLPFHLAVLVDDLASARKFYGELLGCPEGRSSDTWVDFNFFGHQFVCHLCQASEQAGAEHSNAVDGDAVPVPHFGVVLGMDEWRGLADRLRLIGLAFIIEPKIRFAGQTGEQGTFFLRDPAGNTLEFKGFRNLDQLFSI